MLIRITGASGIVAEDDGDIGAFDEVSVFIIDKNQFGAAML